MFISDINSVTPTIQIMMLIQIFEAGIEDDFAWKNTSREEEKMREHHGFSSLVVFPLSPSLRKN